MIIIVGGSFGLIFLGIVLVGFIKEYLDDLCPETDYESTPINGFLGGSTDSKKPDSKSAYIGLGFPVDDEDNQ